MLDTSVSVPMSDMLAMRAALIAVRRARAIAASREFDDDAVRLMVERAECELEEASVAAGFSVPKKPGSCETPLKPGRLKKAA